jgi:hypothetical protein
MLLRVPVPRSSLHFLATGTRLGIIEMPEPPVASACGHENLAGLVELSDDVSNVQDFEADHGDNDQSLTGLPASV